MVVGATGIGKTNFIQGFKTKIGKQLVEDEIIDGRRTLKIVASNYIENVVDNVIYRYTIYDTPGHGDALNILEHWFKVIDKIEELSKSEKTRVHLILYLLEPFRLNNLDAFFMKELAEVVDVLPLIAKIDSMDPIQKESWKKELFKELEKLKIKFQKFGLDYIMGVSGSENGSSRKIGSNEKDYNIFINDPNFSDNNLFAVKFGENIMNIISVGKKNGKINKGLIKKSVYQFRKNEAIIVTIFFILCFAYSLHIVSPLLLVEPNGYLGFISFAIMIILFIRTQLGISFFNL